MKRNDKVKDNYEHIARSAEKAFECCVNAGVTGSYLLRKMLKKDVPNRRIALDFAVLLLLSHTAPLSMVLMVLAMPLQPWWMWLVMAGSLVLAALGMMLLAVVLCRLGGYPLRGMGPTIAMFPVFMASWIPVQVVSVFAPARQWHEIRHEGQPDAGAE